ncbi:MAG: hypothetical protein MUP71_00815 [Candidatus Aminicenantes bacterium]|nr:hypothetical protein [Candidatus Aminicenantes bacterium]
MGISDFFLPERLPRQVIYIGDRHAEVFVLQNKKIISRRRVEGTTLAEIAAGRLTEIAGHLQAENTGIVFNAAPFMYNFFEFDKLPWQKKALRELVAWRLQKVFPESIEAYDHRFFQLDKKRVLSVLVKKSLPEKMGQFFEDKQIPLIYVGNSTMVILSRLLRAKAPPDFFIESDVTGCTLVFQKKRSPIYIRKFKSGSIADTVEEISKTVLFVSNNYGIEPSRYWLIEHRDEVADAAMQEKLAAGNFSRLSTNLQGVPFIPGCQ